MGQSLQPPSQHGVPTDFATYSDGRFPAVKYQITAPFVAEALNDICGQSRIDVDDPRWGQVLNPDVLIELMEHPYALAPFALRLTENNLTTKNFVQLIDHVIANIKTAIKKKSPLQESFIPQCCTGLFIVVNLFHFLCMFLTTDEVSLGFHFTLLFCLACLTCPTLTICPFCLDLVFSVAS